MADYWCQHFVLLVDEKSLTGLSGGGPLCGLLNTHMHGITGLGLIALS